MIKEQGSLGFTLRKEDESVLGHCVRALVRQPATTDGRIRPGDKIVAVNDVEMCQLTHEQAVVFLRMAGDTVKLRLYREEIQTPVALAGDDTGAMPKPKASLRAEAITLLSDLAHRNRKLQTLSSETSELSGSSMRSTSTSTLPRRLKRNGAGGQKSPATGAATSTTTTTTTTTTTSDEGDRTDASATSFTYPRYIVTSQPTTSVGSDSEASSSLISQCSFVVQPADETAIGGGGILDSFNLPSISDADYYEEEELWRVDDDDEDGDDCRGSFRPSSIGSSQLAGKSGSTPVSSRKPRFQFTGKSD